MFRIKPGPDSLYISIRSEIDMYKHDNSDHAQQILQALEATQEFLISTPDEEYYHAEWFADDAIGSILDNATNGLQAIHELAKTDDKIARIYAQCKAAMKETLNSMSPTDKILVYYNTHNNPLKILLNESPLSKELKRD